MQARIIQMPGPEPHEVDLLEQDTLIDEALRHIEELRYQLLKAIDNGNVPLNQLEAAVKVCVLADEWRSQFDDKLELGHG
jgi:hypothetical protein